MNDLNNKDIKKTDTTPAIDDQVLSGNSSGDALGLGRLRKRVPIVALIVVIPIVAGYFFLAAPGGWAGSIIYHLPAGTGLAEAANDLKDLGLIRSASAFRIFFEITYGEEAVKAGDYYLDKPLTVPALAKRVASGVYGATAARVTVPEGWTLRDIGFYFDHIGAFQAEELWELAGFPTADYRRAKDLPRPRDFASVTGLLASKPDYVSLEGYLFPDTYFLYPHEMKPDIIIEIMLGNLDKKITPALRTEIKRQGKTIFQILTMASILEKEAATTEDRRIISGILWKRLDMGMALQVDASLGYITGKASLQLTEDDLKIDSPYNTYKYAGLPLGPIANPGIDAIKAAIYPEDSKYLYYLSDKTGAIHYAETFDKHILNKQKYLYRDGAQ